MQRNDPSQPGAVELLLRGPAGEPVDLERTVLSHGLVHLPPMRVDGGGRTFEVTLQAGRGRPRTVRVEPGNRGRARLRFLGRPPGAAQRALLLERVRHMLRLEEDLSGFYALAAEDPDLRWATRGAGRLIRSPTVFEDVVKTICTTNCAWSATVRMVGALVEHLGERTHDAPVSGPRGRAFPTPEAMAEVEDEFYRGVVRAGYRGAYLKDLARAVAAGDLVLEDLATSPMPDAELEARLLALPGVGPYAAAHIQLMLGRYSRLVLDSWTRPKYVRLRCKRPVKDATIVRRFRRYGTWAGLAFWLTVTSDWC